jgi:glucose/arabinose dehydrogenase
MQENTTKGQHFGSRIVFDNEGYCISQENVAQSLSIHKTSLVTTEKFTAHADGRIPADNPFVGKTGAKEAIYSYGHRNPQGLAKPNYRSYLGSRARTKGGDEINIIKRCCYVWLAVVTYGIDYDGTTISDKTKPGEDPIYYWVPSIAPCGMTL